MSDSAASPTKAKKARKPKAPASHPKYNEMIKAAISNLKERGGSSRQAILKYILANYKIDNAKQANVHLKLALKRMEKSGDLKHVRGKGASGSFKVGKEEKPKVKKVKKPKPAKKPAAKKPKAKKAKPAKKPAKKAAKPKAKAAKKSPKKKPAAKKAAKKTPTKKPKAAKKPAKKAAKTKAKKTTKKAGKK
ncbi:histone H1-delta-like [Branchiostoma floridae]|uniref:Histone H1-delta-like n=1 Tax=Branchiostoma floridae TaxID=7739 RepID=A0A9J7M687_BRAFL|nr:histone H1-delta-like [Branchiostoma floridae]